MIPAYARTGDVDDFELTCWHFAMQPSCLVTGRRSATRSLVNMWQSVEDGLTPASPAKLIELCIAGSAREVRARLASLSANLDSVEDKLELIAAGEAVAIVPAGPLASFRPDLTTIPLDDIEPGHVVLATRAGDRGRLVTAFRKSARDCLTGPSQG